MPKAFSFINNKRGHKLALNKGTYFKSLGKHAPGQPAWQQAIVLAPQVDGVSPCPLARPEAYREGDKVALHRSVFKVYEAPVIIDDRPAAMDQDDGEDDGAFPDYENDDTHAAMDQNDGEDDSALPDYENDDGDSDRCAQRLRSGRPALVAW